MNEMSNLIKLESRKILRPVIFINGNSDSSHVCAVLYPLQKLYLAVRLGSVGGRNRIVFSVVPSDCSGAPLLELVL